MCKCGCDCISFSHGPAAGGHIFIFLILLDAYFLRVSLPVFHPDHHEEYFFVHRYGKIEILRIEIFLFYHAMAAGRPYHNTMHRLLAADRDLTAVGKNAKGFGNAVARRHGSLQVECTHLT